MNSINNIENHINNTQLSSNGSYRYPANKLCYYYMDIVAVQTTVLKIHFIKICDLHPPLSITLLNETVSRMFLDNITETYCTVLTPHYSI